MNGNTKVTVRMHPKSNLKFAVIYKPILSMDMSNWLHRFSLHHRS